MMGQDPDTSLPPSRSAAAPKLIVAFLALQLGVGFYPLVGPGLKLDPLVWPFLSYAMYSDAYFEGDSIDEYVTVAVLADGTRDDIGTEDLDVDFWGLDALANALLDDNADAVRDYVAAYEERSGARVTALRLESRPILMERSGPSIQPRTLVKLVEIDPSESGP